MKNFNMIKLLVALVVAISGIFSASASSHREAPLIANDPLADNTDLYAFRSPNDTNTVTLMACYVPLQNPHGGPNYYNFGENVRYEVHVDNDAGTTGDDIIYRFTFTKTNQDPTTFFYIRLGQQNQKMTYMMERSVNGGASFQTVISNGIVPPNNIGERSITGGAGLNTNYNALFTGAITNASSGEQVFCGPADDPFFVDLGGVFDLGDLPRQGGMPHDGVAKLNVSVIAIKVPISTLQKQGKNVTQAANILDSDFVIGVWASASRQQMRTLSTNGTASYSGGWVQVSRIGMPLTNEVVIPIGQKDYWNSLTPYNEDPSMDAYFCNPELGLYMDNSLFGGAVPALAPLRIQRNSLQAFDFGNTNDGLWPIRATNGGAGTALDTMIFGNYLLRQGQPRSVDLLPIFYTGVPNLAPYQLATGKGGNPLAVGKPFINNFLPTFGDMLRLNMAVPVTPRNHPEFSSEGIIAAAVLGLTNPAYNSNANLQFIPNMDGFPNGRRLEDDVTRIELQTVSGVALAAIGLWYDDYTAGGPNPVTPNLVNVLSYSTGVDANDTTFRSTFPYVQTPWIGTGNAGGKPVSFTQAACLAPSNCTLTLTVNPNPTNPYMAQAIIGACTPNYTVYYRKVTGNSAWSTVVTSSTTANLTVLAPATAYVAYVEDNNGIVSANAYFTTSGTNNCGVAPTGFTAVANCNKIDISWNNSGYTHYITYIRQVTPMLNPTSNGQVVLSGTSTSLTVPVSGYGQMFEVSVAGKCGNTYSVFANPIYVTVADPRPAQVMNVAFSGITCKNITTTWDAVPGAIGYRIRFKNPTSNTVFANVFTTNTSYTRTGLTSNFTYEIFVTAIGCNNLTGISSLRYSVQTCSGTVTGLGSRTEDPGADLYDNLQTYNMDGILNDNMALYPNPNKGTFQIAIEEFNDANGMIEVVNMLGQTVYRQEVMAENGIFSHEVKLPESYPTGTYLVKVTTVSGNYRAKIVKQ